jgi:hypothetical protein
MYLEDMARTLLSIQIESTKKVFDSQVTGLDATIYHAMDL